VNRGGEWEEGEVEVVEEEEEEEEEGGSFFLACIFTLHSMQ